MNKKYSSYVAILIFSISSTVFAKDVCKAKLDKYTISQVGVTTICDWATKISDEIQMITPKQLTYSLIVEKSTPQNNTITVVSRINYDYARWKEITAETGSTPETTQPTLAITLQQDICSDDNKVYDFRDFIKAGGQVTYEYFFVDSTLLITQSVKDCSVVN